MVLKIQFNILLLIFSINLFSQSDFEIFYTDKYNTNYFSTSTNKNTKLNIGSDLFQFIEVNKLNTCRVFIDSFLTTEEIDFNQQIQFNNNNVLEIEIFNTNAIQCSKISEIWFEKYNISWITLLKTLVNFNDIEESDAKIMILKKLYSDEVLRPFHTGNLINNTFLSFVIPSRLSSHDFRRSKTHLNTKRYTSLESNFNFTEIIFNESLKGNELIYNSPSFNKHTFLKNAISLYLLKRLLPEQYQLEMNYSIGQGFIKVTTILDSTNIQSIKLDFSDVKIDTLEFKKLKEEAIKDVKAEINENNLFFYSYYDLLRLKQLEYLYKIEFFYKEIDLLFTKEKFVIEISDTSKLSFNNTPLEEIHLNTFRQDIFFKANSVKFKNNNDTLLFSKLNLFLKLNTNYNLAIKSSSKKSEYLFIGEQKKDAIISKFEKSKYIISTTHRLKLYRSLVIFNKLLDLGMSPERINCVGIRNKTAKVNFEFLMID